MPAIAPERLTVVMVRPRYGVNVGAMARAAANFGLAGLKLVAPNEMTQADLAERVAKAGGEEHLERAVTVATLEEALAGIDLAVGTSHRGGRHREPMAPWTLAQEVLPALAPRTVALVLGPEDHGLTWEDMERCDRLVSIPSETPLNVAQAGIVLLYELCVRPAGTAPRSVADRRYRHLGDDREEAPGGVEPGDVTRIVEAAGRALSLTGYPHHRKTLREEMNQLADILSRAAPNRWETRFLMGMFRHVERWATSAAREGSQG